MNDNPLDRIIAWWSPLRGARRAIARRVYEGAAQGRRTTSFNDRRTSANNEIGPAITYLRNRARELVRNSPYSGRMINIICAASVGTGITPVPRTGSDRLDIKVMKLWNEWQQVADREGVLSFNAMQRLAVRSMIESGEVVMRFRDRPMRNRDVAVPLKLQLLEADFIDHNREGVIAQPQPSAATMYSRLGVGLGEEGERTGLWLYQRHPGEFTTFNVAGKGYPWSMLSQFEPVGNYIHLFRQDRPGQVRGVSWLAPILISSRDLSDFMDAVNVKARVEACFAGFVTNSDELEAVMDASTLNGGSAANPNAMMSTLEPGMLKELKAGQDIKFAQPTGATQVETVLMFNLMGQAAGLNCTYDQISGDLRQANYSSLRAGKIDFRRFITTEQELTIIPMLCEPVWKRFISRATLAGELAERTNGYPCDWVTPSWEAINPKIDLDAEQHLVRSGRISPQEYIAQDGRDWRKVLADWKEFRTECENLGLVFDIMPDKVTRTGAAQPVPTDGTTVVGEGAVDDDGNAIDAPADDNARVIALVKKKKAA